MGVIINDDVLPDYYFIDSKRELVNEFIAERYIPRPKRDTIGDILVSTHLSEERYAWHVENKTC